MTERQTLLEELAGLDEVLDLHPTIPTLRGPAFCECDRCKAATARRGALFRELDVLADAEEGQ